MTDKIETQIVQLDAMLDRRKMERRMSEEQEPFNAGHAAVLEVRLRMAAEHQPARVAGLMIEAADWIEAQSKTPPAPAEADTGTVETLLGVGVHIVRLNHKINRQRALLDAICRKLEIDPP